MKRLLLLLICFPLTLQAQETKTSIGFNFYPSYSDVHYMTASSVADGEVESANQLEGGLFTFSGNMFFRHQLHDRLDISWGIGYRDVGFKSSLEMVVLPQGTQEFVSTTFRQGFLQFPVSLNFNITKGLYVSGGIIGSTLIDAKFRQEMAGLSGDDESLSGGDTRNLNTFQLSSTLGVGYKMKLSEQWSFYVEPSFSYCFTPQQFNEAFDRSPWRVGANFGVVHQF